MGWTHRTPSSVARTLKHTLVVRNDEPGVRAGLGLAKAELFQQRCLGIAREVDRHDSKPRETVEEPRRGEASCGIRLALSCEDFGHGAQLRFGGARRDVTAEDAVLGEAVALGPGVQEQVRIASPDPPVLLSDDEFVELELGDDPAGEALVHLRRRRELSLGQWLARVHEQPASDARALGSEGGRRPARALVPIRLTLDLHAESWGDEAGVAAQVEPADTRLFAALPTCGSHEGHGHQRESRACRPWRLAPNLPCGVRNSSDGARALPLDDEGEAAELDDCVGVSAPPI